MTALSKNEELVLHALKAAKEPQTAYALLDQLRDQGLRAPPQIYRALEKLTAQGIVHRIESLNAFVVCNQPDCSQHALAAFTICDSCGTVGEVNHPQLAQKLTSLGVKSKFSVKASTVEMRGVCAACQNS